MIEKSYFIVIHKIGKKIKLLRVTFDVKIKKCALTQ